MMTRFGKKFALIGMVLAMVLVASKAFADVTYSKIDDVWAAGFSKQLENGATGTTSQKTTFTFSGKLDCTKGSGLTLPQTLEKDQPFTVWYEASTSEASSVEFKSIEEVWNAGFAKQLSNGASGTTTAETTFSFSGKLDCEKGSGLTLPQTLAKGQAFTVWYEAANGDDSGSSVVVMTSEDLLPSNLVRNESVSAEASEEYSNLIVVTPKDGDTVEIDSIPVFVSVINYAGSNFVAGTSLEATSAFSIWYDEDQLTKLLAKKVSSSNLEEFFELDSDANDATGAKKITSWKSEDECVTPDSGCIIFQAHRAQDNSVKYVEEKTLLVRSDLDGEKEFWFVSGNFDGTSTDWSSEESIKKTLFSCITKTLNDTNIADGVRRKYLEISGFVLSDILDFSAADSRTEPSFDDSVVKLSAEGNILIREDGYAIGKVTLYVVVDAPKSNGGDSGSGGGGGCDMGIGGFALLVTLPLVLKGKRS